MCAGGLSWSPNNRTSFPEQDRASLVPGETILGIKKYVRPNGENANQSASMPQSSIVNGSPVPIYNNSQQPIVQEQQMQSMSTPRATTKKFSFNNGNFRIGDSTMNSSDSGLNI
jgi:hypothetical protein